MNRILLRVTGSVRILMLLVMIYFSGFLNTYEVPIKAMVADNTEWVKNETRKLSSDSWFMLSQYDKLPASQQGKLPNGGTISSNKSVPTFFYLKGKSKTDLLVSMATNVHEIGHAYFNQNIFRYTREHGITMKWDNAELYIYVSPSEGYFVSFPRKSLFPAHELASSIPDSLRTFRYKTYIKGKTSTQTEGVIGLLNELAAYFLGSRYSYDMLDAYKDAEGSEDLGFFSWVMNSESTMSAWYEFDFFIREYLLSMKQNHPSEYKTLKSNSAFSEAYKAVSSSYRKLVNDYQTMINKQMKSLNSSGKAKFSMIGNMLWMQMHGSTRSRGTTIFSEDKEKLSRVLKSSRYRSIEADYPSFH